MQIGIDNSTKTITIHSKITIEELIVTLAKLQVDPKKWSIEPFTKQTEAIQLPWYPSRPYNPYNPILYNTCGNLPPE